jgi:hypothetical protein
MLVTHQAKSAGLLNDKLEKLPRHIVVEQPTALLRFVRGSLATADHCED